MGENARLSGMLRAGGTIVDLPFTSLVELNMPTSFKLAMVQMRVDGGAKDKNLARAEDRIAEAAQNGAEVVLLPEALTLGWTHPSSLTEAEPIPSGESCQ